MLGIGKMISKVFNPRPSPASRTVASDVEEKPGDRVSIQADSPPAPKIIRRKASGLAAEYRDNFDFQDDMNSLATKHPKHVKMLELGRSVQGRVIAGMSVGTGPIGIAVTGLVHGCEWTTGEATFELAKHIVEERPELLEEITLLAVPVSNPDGQELSRGVIRGQRGNVNGVDSNRNWPVNWGTNENTSKEICHEYGGTGPAPLSEPETQALNKLTEEQYGVKGWLDLHSHGEMLLYPESQRPEAYGALVADMQKATSKPYEAMTIQEFQPITGSLGDYCESNGILSIGAELGTRHKPKGSERESTIQDGVALGMAFVDHLVQNPPS